MLVRLNRALPKRAAARQSCRFQTMDEGGTCDRGLGVARSRPYDVSKCGLAVRIFRSIVTPRPRGRETAKLFLSSLLLDHELVTKDAERTGV
jgi:hypothetical protein